MGFLSSTAAAFIEGGWYIAGVVVTVIYTIILVLMIIKAKDEEDIEKGQENSSRTLFYLGQTYLAFMWPIPLFLALEFFDVLG